MILCYLIFIILFIYKIEPSKIRPNFDEIFGDGWEKNEREEKVMIKIEQNEQNEQNDNSTAVDQMGEEMGNGPNDQQKRETVKKFDAIKEKLKEKGKFEWKNQSKIETKIGRLLGANRKLIQKWKNELNLNKNKIKKQIYEQKKRNFSERFNEFEELNGQRKQKEFVKELGISKDTFIKWKKELLPKYNKTQHTNFDKLKKMKQYYEIKERNPKIGDIKIVDKLGIGITTLKKWKKKFAPFSTI